MPGVVPRDPPETQMMEHVGNNEEKGLRVGGGEAGKRQSGIAEMRLSLHISRTNKGRAEAKQPRA